MRISKKIGLAVLVTALSAATIIGCGKKKEVPPPEPVKQEVVRKPIYHMVKSGDLYFRLAKEYNTKVDSLRTWNPQYRLGYIRTGDSLIVGYKTEIEQSVGGGVRTGE